MPNPRTLAVASLLAAALAAAPARAACTYSVDPRGIKVEWTAFKFTQKQAVTGSFNTTKVSGPTQATSLVELAKGLSMEIDGASIESGNPARNATISEFFFQKFAPPSRIIGKTVEVEGDDAKGTVEIEITLNDTSRVVPFAYTISKDHQVEAAATIDMMDFALQKAYDSLHLACEEQHTGEDKVSKTWTEVGLKLTGKFAQSCA